MEKRNNDNKAIYTLAASILVSSIIVSMNQASGAPTDSQISNLKSCINSNFRNVDWSIRDLSMDRKTTFFARNC